MLGRASAAYGMVAPIGACAALCLVLANCSSKVDPYYGVAASPRVVSYGDTVEHAYWWTEVLDAYCRILLMARDLGRVNYFDERKTRELLEFKTRLGFKDARLEPDMENCDICANDVFRDSWKRTGVDRKAFEPPPPMGKAKSTDADQETLIQAITDRVVAALKT